MITIYHNGRCSKSRGALEILREKGVPHEVRYYLAEPLSRDELSNLLGLLRMQPSELLRRTEAMYKEQQAAVTSEDEWLQLMTDHPELIERPIVVNGSRAVVARPPERVLEVL
jgi:arsenate reductase